MQCSSTQGRNESCQLLLGVGERGEGEERRRGDIYMYAKHVDNRKLPILFTLTRTDIERQKKSNEYLSMPFYVEEATYLISSYADRYSWRKSWVKTYITALSLGHFHAGSTPRDESDVGMLVSSTRALGDEPE